MAQKATYQLQVNNQEYTVETRKGQGLSGTLNGEDYSLDLQGNARQGFSLVHEHGSYAIQVLAANYTEKTFTLRINQEVYTIQAADKYDLLLKELGMDHLAGAAVNDLKAPMPGLVLDLKVAPGDTLKKGDPVVVLEAMKMENVLKAEADATVKSVNCQKGEAVEKNQVLVELE
jgi:acetyl/propionyl-CoA carboxylase alpha subunit